MVLKTSRRGIRTGGTVRSHPGPVHKYDLRSKDHNANITVYRQDDNQSTLNLPEHFESGLQYSLNKRERWNLPEKVYEQVKALAIEDAEEHKSASDGKEKPSVVEHRRNSVVMIQHPGTDDPKTHEVKGSFVIYYDGGRYGSPVEKLERKNRPKLDSLNIVAQLEDGTFFGGRSKNGEDDVAKPTNNGERKRRVLRTVRDNGDHKRLVQLTGPRTAPAEGNVNGEHVHVFLADKKHASKHQVQKQPKKQNPMDQHRFPVGRGSHFVNRRRTIYPDELDEIDNYATEA